MRNPIHDPAIKGAAAAWHSMIAYAEQCALLSVIADHSLLTVTDDYEDARAQLVESMKVRALHEVYEAAMRFQAAIEVPDMPQMTSSGAGTEELALIGAVIMLRGSLCHLDEALRHLPGPDEETTI